MVDLPQVEQTTKQPQMLPVVCTRNLVLFPGLDNSFEVGRTKSIKAIEYAKEKCEGFILSVAQKSPEIEDPDQNDLYSIGLLSSISRISKPRTDGSLSVGLVSIRRVRISDFNKQDAVNFANYEVIESVYGDKKTEVALVRNLAKSIEVLANNTPDDARILMEHLSDSVDANTLADTIATFMIASVEKKQEILETIDVNKRLELIIEALSEEQEISEIEKDIKNKMRTKFDENQREYVLREKLKTIKEELGDTPDKDDDSEAMRNKLADNPYPDYIKSKITDELKRYDMLPPASAESSIVWSYIDWVMNIPWWQRSQDNDDLKNVEKVLNDDHYGLEKPKTRIIEYLAVKRLTSSLKAPIICFSGPPGTGKTSLSNSIARALGRPIVKVSLGGISDEAEIRGHRRTYLGSMPGRIIQGMKKAGVVNPVFLLDEIDKVGSDYKGDPSSALLEVLDPEQNKSFSDNYLEEPYDLSNVLFIATANYLENVAAPLRDRLEIIELSSYTEEEKLHIAQKHLVKKQLDANGLKANQISFTTGGIMHIIRCYTREAGVRELERNIGSICRKIGVKIVKGDFKDKEIIDANKVKEYLGTEKFEYTKKETKAQVGVVTGLAYTQYGGDILPVEAVTFEGKGNIVITGNLGNVMKESASIALGYVKANAERFKIDPKTFDNTDIHLHFPEGAVPKDGPSAGVTIVTCLVSALTHRPVKQDIAMTGEVTLRGNILPIGGLREKSIAAHRSHIKTIYVPKENERDIEEVPESVRKDLKIVYVEHVSQIIDQVLEKAKKNGTK
ncbi:MAG: endopeptidase La [Bacilli bacterium]|nr:endopeptidase La [Bacilli bacterium]